MRPFLLGVLSCLAPGIGCGDAARDGRRADAFDLEGQYDGPDGLLQIVNEQDRNDVRLTLVRAFASPGEQDLLARRIDVDQDGRQVEMGRGKDGLLFEVDGGENVSFDGGESSTVSVTGVDFPALGSAAGATQAVLRWSARLVANAEGRLVGTLSLSSRERRLRPAEVDAFTTQSEHIDVAVAFVRRP